MIGALGDVAFVVSADTIRTFDELSRSTASRWEKHDIIGRKSKLEYIGPDVDSISFTMRFDVAYGMDPREEMNALLELARSGKAVPLVIGGRFLGVNKWIVKSVTQNWLRVDNRGNLLLGTAEVTLEEYV